MTCRSITATMLSLVTVSLMMSGCVGTPILTESTWEILSVRGTTIDRSPGTRGLPMFRFLPDSNKVMGYTGCNQFSGSFTQVKNKVTIGPLATTKAACPTMDLEQKVLSALTSTTSVDMDGDILQFLDGDSVLMECKSTPLPMKK